MGIYGGLVKSIEAITIMFGNAQAENINIDYLTLSIKKSLTFFYAINVYDLFRRIINIV